ncbi:MAG: hypothetical protein JWM11_3390 [Planctomycetaceae bacterium]|nr:hypothetical protein [Planctomycetaceae bacterium]
MGQIESQRLKHRRPDRNAMHYPRFNGLHEPASDRFGGVDQKRDFALPPQRHIGLNYALRFTEILPGFHHIQTNRMNLISLSA